MLGGKLLFSVLENLSFKIIKKVQSDAANTVNELDI